VRAAFLAIAFRLAGLSLSALALPPFNPPLRPSSTAAGFLVSGSVPGLGSSPVAMRSTLAASWFGSRGIFGRLAMKESYRATRYAGRLAEIQTDPLPRVATESQRRPRGA